jgi:hypothetical protein
MFLDLFIVPRKLVINEKKAERTVKSSIKVVQNYWQATGWSQINSTQKKCLFYGVFYDDEWFDPRLVEELRAVLIGSLNIEMFSVFRAEGDGKVRYEPRIFARNLRLNPDISNQPLPFHHEKVKHEKLIGGWLYVD